MIETAACEVLLYSVVTCWRGYGSGQRLFSLSLARLRRLVNYAVPANGVPFVRWPPLLLAHVILSERIPKVADRFVLQ